MMDVLVCVWRLAVPVRILVNAVIGARESKDSATRSTVDRNNLNRQHIQKGLCRSQQLIERSDDEVVNVSCARDTHDLFFVVVVMIIIIINSSMI